jgi:hypothetical protein
MWLTWKLASSPSWLIVTWGTKNLLVGVPWTADERDCAWQKKFISLRSLKRIKGMLAFVVVALAALSSFQKQVLIVSHAARGGFAHVFSPGSWRVPA